MYLVSQPVATKNAYREYRSQIIKGLEKSKSHYFNHRLEGCHPLQELRERITAFRNHLVIYRKQKLNSEPEIEPFFRMALRIPAGIPLLPTKFAISRQFLMGFLPISVNVLRARVLLKSIGTFEGRRFVFETQVKRAIWGQYYFNESLDFALRYLQPPRNLEDFHRIYLIDIDLMRVCHRLGKTGLDDVKRIFFSQVGRETNWVLVLKLVELGVIDSFDSLFELPVVGDRYRCLPDKLNSTDIRVFGQAVMELQGAGVENKAIIKLLTLDVKDFDIPKLKSTLAIIKLGDSELSELFTIMTEQVVLRSPERWRFLVNILGAHGVADIVLFKRLLDSGQTPSIELALNLQTAGANISALAACQALILAAGIRKNRDSAIKVQLLLAASSKFTFEKLALAEDYLLDERDLASFLNVLAKYGYKDAQSILAFQPCYRQLSANELDSWLNIAGEMVHPQPVAVVVDWIVRAGRGGYITSFNYLLKTGELRTFTHLKQALKLAPLGTTILRYIREECGLCGLSVLLKWYHHDAPGIKDLRFWGEINAATKVLLDDAFERKNYHVLKSNLEYIDKFVDQRVNAVLGLLPNSAGNERRDAYYKKYHDVCDEVAPGLKALLAETGGVLVLSILELLGASVGEIRTRITQFSPTLNKLLTGNGPTSQELSDVEADLIALVYRTSSRVVRNYWHQLINFEGHVAWLTTDTPYSMYWFQTEQKLDGIIDLHGLNSLKEAIQFALNFSTNRQKDMHIACRFLSPKKLGHPAADVWSLASHLGVLMAIAGDDSNVSIWLEDGGQVIDQMVEPSILISQQVDSLHRLFDVQLEDALDVLEIDFVGNLSDDDALFLASRLDRNSAADFLSVKDMLRSTLIKTRKKVLPIYLDWAAKQKKCFTHKKNVKNACTLMQAYVSKSPSAFFAKQAAGICTRDNIAMWQEHRHAHLLVFSPEQKCLTGMALLYFERIPALSVNRDTLIIRAINPMENILASHEESSIVDSYFNVAISIAMEHGLAAVAFPCSMGMHLMSNYQNIEKDIKNRFIKRALKFTEWDMESLSTSWLTQPRKVAVEFYAYELGEVLVNELFAVWHAKDIGQDKPNEA